MIQHHWQPIPQYEGSPYEQRWCPRCRLSDIRCTSDSMFPESKQWKVTTPCIVHVPPMISFRKLVSEIYLNVRNRRAADELLGRVRCVGIPGSSSKSPGRWQVGLYIADGAVYPHHDKPFKTLEEGFAELLRWLRARQFDPNKHSSLQYCESLAQRHCGCGDDD